jgi:hypothetical protein
MSVNATVFHMATASASAAAALASSSATAAATVVPFKVGDPITFSAFTSISLNAAVVDTFSDHLIYVFNDVVGLDVSALSAYPSEAELLLPPPCVFQITALTPMPNKRLLMVHLKQVPPDASYLPLSPFPAVPHDHNLRQIFADESRRPVLESSRLQEVTDNNNNHITVL